MSALINDNRPISSLSAVSQLLHAAKRELQHINFISGGRYVYKGGTRGGGGINVNLQGFSRSEPE
jgi:hypothetical protein